MTTTINNTGNLLELQGVHTHIGAYHILHGVDLAVPKGQLTMLLGRNGAGKTTTLRTIMGLWHASQGSIHFGGRDITAMNTPAIASLNIAYVPENMGIFADLTVKENMLLAARSASNAAQMDEARLQWIFKLFPAVEKFWNHPAGKLSGGQKQMVAVSRAIVEPRDLLIVDEPSKGLAPAIINNMIDAFDQLKKSGVTILLVEQNINFAKRLGDTVAVMDNGAVVHAGSMKALAEDEEASVDAQRQVLGRLEARHPVVLVGEHDVEGPWGPDRQERPDGVGGAEPRDQLVHGRVGEHVAVVREEHLVVAEVAAHPAQPLADLGVEAGVDEGDAPVADVAAQQLHVAPAAREDEVVARGLLVVQEVVLDELPAVAEAEDELRVPEVGVVAHDVPQNRPVADPDHRLRDALRLLPHAHAEPAAEDHDLHRAAVSSPIQFSHSPSILTK